jgi:hypothetical protein
VVDIRIRWSRKVNDLWSCDLDGSWGYISRDDIIAALAGLCILRQGPNIMVEVHKVEGLGRCCNRNTRDICPL